MSGRNIALGISKHRTRDLEGMPVEAQQSLVRSYCDKHPLADYWIAVMALFESLPEDPTSAQKNSN
jgi:hypothetical protein